MPKISLFQKFLKNKSDSQENYLALTITPDKVLAFIWSLDNNGVQKLGFAQKAYQDNDELTHQAAITIDEAGEEAKSDVAKVVFGIPKSWFDQGELSPKNAKLLEGMSQDLELEAQAFVPLSVSVKNLLKAQEKTPPHAILLGLYEDSFEAHLVQNNQITASLASAAKPTIEGIENLIKSFQAKESLPSKIVIFGKKNTSGIANELDKGGLDSLFAKKPKIDFLNDENLALSTAFAQASDIQGHEVNLESEAKPENKDQSPKPDEFGFVQGQDILDKKQKPQTALNEQTEESNLQEVDFKKPDNQPLDEPQMQNAQIPKTSTQKGSLIEQIVTLAWFDKITSVFKKPQISKKIAILALILILGFILAGLVLGQTITRAQVTIKIRAQSQEANFSAQVDSNSVSDFENNEIAGEQISSSALGNQKSVATGKKKSGNNAKGEVTVFNWTTSKISFPKETKVISKNGIKFNLDSEIEIASRSASTPGQTKTTVTATEYGDSGNLAGGNDFSLQQYDELLYSARNDAAFTGGDEKEITVVSQQDMDKLEKSLLSSLKDKAIADLKSQNSQKIIHDELITVETQSKQYDKNLDEEASLVNLDLEVVAKTIAYDQNILKDFLAQLSNKQAPEGLEAHAQNIEPLSVSAKSGKGVLTLSGKFKTNYIPKLDQDQIKEKLSAKNRKQAREILKEISQVDDVSVNFSPPFLPFSKIPKNKERISLKIETI